MRMIPLKEIAPAKGSDQQFDPDEVVWQLTLDQIEADTGRIVDRVNAPATSAGTSTYTFDKGNVLYSKLRPYLNKVICPDEAGIATTELVPLRPLPGELDRQYLCHYLRSPEFVHWVSNQVSGAKMPRVNMKVFWKHEIPTPPIDEQKRIAAILDKAEAIQHKRAGTIRLADDFLKSVFLDIFGDPVTNPKGWEVEPLSSVVTQDGRGLKRGPFGGSLKKEIFVSEGYKVYEQQHAIADDFTIGRYYIDDLKYDEMQAFAVRPGDMIVSCSGTIGRVAIVPADADPGIINQALLRVTPDSKKISALYLKALLETDSIQHTLYGFSRGSGLKNFPSMSEVKAVQIPVPSRESLATFHRVVDSMASARERLEEGATESNDLMSSLVHRAFRGEL